MIDDLVCSHCSESCLSKDNTYEFYYEYKGFSDLIACNLVNCLNCNSEDESLTLEIIQKAKEEYEESIDSLILQFYMYADVNLNKHFKHYKKGTSYKLLLITNLESTDQAKFPTTAVYQDKESMLIWSRPLSEFIKNFTIQGN